MKKIFLQSLILSFAGFVIFISCKKDKEDNAPKTKTELLTTGTWKLTSYTSTPAYDWYGNGVYATDILAALNPCEADGFDTYKINGIVEINEGAIKCDPMDPQTFTATWAFTDNENKIIYDGFDEYELVELTATTMRLQSTFIENGVSYTHYETFEH
ncbi:MAG TPA: hypothetical protein VJ765_00405 [Chitinophagaceae bacterium]|nr:hypothetical protein [Chitinophagaceae bacterium]